jgi:dethiobiotin synthetase
VNQNIARHWQSQRHLKTSLQYDPLTANHYAGMTIALNGLFITGTDTEVGKTYVGALIARALVKKGFRVGVYKPAASGCRREGERLVSDDAVQLWEAAGRPGPLEKVCPQCFSTPLAPHLAARAEGKEVDVELLRSGLEYWRGRSDVVLVEGAGGLLSPISDSECAFDLARDFGFPLVIVARNVLGVINHTLLMLHAARTLHGGLPVAGIILNHPAPPGDDRSLATNAQEIQRHGQAPILVEVPWNAGQIDLPPHWF